ncbi:MFS transporter [Lactobacillus sp.] [Lactiplantibacillus mudanjiangensis]|uniref:DHA2 family efflux MFS transporter permease subunit n=1 Tax=Lactiplantibacillus mudanjiangensis TaxID=1296538 RepID=UPI00101421B1|nr:MFS transporter [Lactobacillus sp.] [Lactiplantibacillus mudanjiangensis]
MSVIKRTLLATTLLIAVFTALLNQTVMITALPVIMHQFQINLSSAQWLTTGYVLILGIVTPISAILYQRFSTRKLFITLISGFIIATTLGLLATNYAILLLARLLQAVMGGVLMTFSQITLISLFPASKRGTILGLFSMVISAGPAIGPTFAGVLLNTFTWRSLFTVVLVIMVIVLIIGILALPNVTTGKAVNIDWLSVGLSFIGMGITLIGINDLQTMPGKAVIIIALGLLLLGWFVQRQLTSQTSLLNIRLFTNQTFTRMTLIVMLTFAIMMGTETILPLLLETHVHLSSMAAGLIMLPGALANLVLAPIVGHWYDRYGLRKLLPIGLLILTISLIPFLFVTTQTPIWLVMLAYFIRMAGCAIITSVTVSAALAGFNADSLSHATALNNTVRQVAGSLGNTLMVWALSFGAHFNTGFRFAILLTLLATLGIIVITIIHLRSMPHSNN